MLHLLSLIQAAPNSTVQGINQDIIATNNISLGNCFIIIIIISHMVTANYIVKAFGINFNNFISMDYYKVIIVMLNLVMLDLVMLVMLMEVNLVHILLLPPLQNFNF